MSVAEQIKESLGPFIAEDESGDLAGFVDSLTAPLETVYEIAGEEIQTFGWSVVLDPATCPAAALDWLAQFEGVTLTEDMNEADRRAAIAAREGAARGRPATIESRVRRTLATGGRVVIRERDPSPYSLYVRTFASETPDSDLTRSAILAQKPAGIVLDYAAISDGTYADLLSEFPTYADVPSVTYTELQTELSE